MKLFQVRKKGKVKIESIDQSLKERLSVFGIKEGCFVFVSTIRSCGYQLVICDERLVALPDYVLKGITI